MGFYYDEEDVAGLNLVELSILLKGYKEDKRRRPRLLARWGQDQDIGLLERTWFYAHWVWRKAHRRVTELWRG